jgi:F0F1-type ATP synthase assembly protein I
MAIQLDRVVLVVVFVLVFTVARDLDDDVHGVHGGVSLLIGRTAFFEVLFIVLTTARLLSWDAGSPDVDFAVAK